MKTFTNNLLLDSGPRFKFPMNLFVIISLLGLVACVDTEKDNKSPPLVETTAIQVFKSPSCRCCSKWVKHIENTGFSAAISNTRNLNAIKLKHGIAPRYQSCHTAVAEGYVFEGHIPAHVMQRFLAEKPENAIGLSVPGMPIGSPGMEMKDRHDDYEVLLLTKDGEAEVYEYIISVESHNGK
ncbi:DUF411 domain-containing protein [Dasania marina]|uniref:DUF411 domain-containing protein n=1 Tax=Dasania marina TaxID=471499 RepID=UPI0030DC3597